MKTKAKAPSTITLTAESRKDEPAKQSGPENFLLKTDDQSWRIVQMCRKSVVLDVMVDLLRDLDSLDEKLKQCERFKDARAMKMQLASERAAVAGVLKRLLAKQV